MKRFLQYSVLVLMLFSIYCCSRIDYATIKNHSGDKISIKLNGKLFIDDKNTVLVKQKDNFFEYEIQPNAEEILAEIYNTKFNEDVFNFDTLIIVSKKTTLQLNSKNEIFNQFKAANKGGFEFVVSE